MLEGRNKKSLQKSSACVFVQGPRGYFKVKHEKYPSKCGRTCGCRALGYMSRSCRVVWWPTSPQIHLCAASLRVAVDSTLVDGPGGACRAAEGRVCPRSPDDDPADMRRAERMGHSGALICSTSQPSKRKITLLPGENIISCLLACFAFLR